ncbi:MAG: bifunctional diguanylate cyclase/phosphodiesterase [Acidothermus sp.]|nr:bifunctional diguanylate cyclase/phosphodiesterase [Acidothermus sp.]
MTVDLREAAAWFRETCRHVGVGVALLDVQGRILAANDELAALLRTPADELVGRGEDEFVHPDDRQLADWGIGDDAQRTQLRLLRPDGEIAYAIRILRPLRERFDGSLALAHYLDVTEHNSRLVGLAELGEFAQTVADDRSGAELVSRARNLLTRHLALADDQAAAALGGSPDVLELLGGEDRAFVRSIASILETAQARRRAENARHHLAAHDGLTGLANRATFAARVDEAVGRIEAGREYLCILMIDIDGFKRVNDSLGHLHGDRLLRDVAQRITGVVRPTDTVARIGGDEFAVLLTGLTVPEEAEAIATRVRDAFRAPFAADGRAVHLSASIGVATARSRATDPTEFLADADLAMTEAKSTGKGRCVVFRPALRKAAAHRIALEEDLRVAVERGNFRLDFQPIVELATGRWIGAEALLRWPHPTRGLVPPLDFIPLAEDSGLVVPLGRWVLRTALQHRVAWSEQLPRCPDFCVSVNVSVRQLAEPDFPDDVAHALDATGVPPSALVLEMTESVFMDAENGTLRTLEAIHGLGVRLAIDDFGTGYSALSYLRNFPVDILKLDRSFVAGLLGTAQDRAVTSAVIGLAHQLDIDLVAEGIETFDQLEILRELGCRLGQGYLLHRPMAADAIPATCPAA